MRKMRCCIIGIFLFSWICLGIAGEESVGNVTFMIGDRGDVRVQHKNQKAWNQARLYAKVLNGDLMKTQPESRCEIKLKDGSVIRIGERSSFAFRNMKTKDKGRFFDSFLNFGKIWVNVRTALLPTDQFHIQAPAAVCAVRGTVYGIEADSTTRISVYEGAVDVGPNDNKQTNSLKTGAKILQPQEVSGPSEVPGPFEVTLDQWIRIVAGFQVEIRRNGTYAKTPLKTVANAQSDWQRWNKERDQIINR